MPNSSESGEPAQVESITAWVKCARAGDREAADRLYRAVYDELRRIARAQRSRHGRFDANDANDAVTTTALVHELYLRLEKAENLVVADRHHFLSLAARIMRQVLIDAARREMASRRGAGTRLESIDADFAVATPERPRELVELDDALARLEEQDAQLARLVDLHFFAGLSLAQIAEVSGGSERTLRRQWRRARAFLYDQLRAAS